MLFTSSSNCCEEYGFVECAFLFTFKQPLKVANEVIQRGECDGRRDCVIVFLSDGESNFSRGTLVELLRGRKQRK